MSGKPAAVFATTKTRDSSYGNHNIHSMGEKSPNVILCMALTEHVDIVQKDGADAYTHQNVLGNNTTS